MISLAATMHSHNSPISSILFVSWIGHMHLLLGYTHLLSMVEYIIFNAESHFDGEA
jgi:hypothetical protein